MNKFELYCMIYYVLDAEWDENKDEELGKFLSSANPFQFKDIGSADPLIYEEFCGKVPDIITLDDSYECARNYVNALGNEEVQICLSYSKQRRMGRVFERISFTRA